MLARNRGPKFRSPDPTSMGGTQVMTGSSRADEPAQNSVSASYRRVGVATGFAAICLLAYVFQPQNAGTGDIGPWYSVLPPLIAITAVLLTGRLLSSLIFAVLCGAWLAATASGTGGWLIAPDGIQRAAGYVWGAVSDSWNLQIIGFIPFMMAMVAVVIAAGGFHAIVERISRFSYGRKTSQLTTVFAGLFLFFDDYANTMVVGSGMRPMTDKKNISRAKLAFLVDATSAPIAGVALMSTWIGYEIGLFADTAAGLGIDKDGFSMFLDALGFRFYCIMMIVFVLFNAATGRDWGAMAKAEAKAAAKAPDEAVASTTQEKNPEAATEPEPTAQPRLKTALGPLAVLLFIMVAGLWLDGGGAAKVAADPLAPLSLGAWQDVLINVENSVTVLLVAAVAGFFTACGFALASGRISATAIGRATLHGVKISAVPIAILTLAWSLKASCDDLHTGDFLVAAVGTSVSALWFPAVLFLVSGLTAFATGTSWGTMAILIPTALPIAYELDGGSYALVTMISLGAVLDGAIFGDHCSPISDTTIMSSTASSCGLIEHVYTQLPYALTVGGLAVVCGYVPAAAGVPSWVGVLAATAIIGLLYAFKARPQEATQPAGRGNPAKAVREEPASLPR